MLNILSIAILLLTTDITILKNNDHVVSDNLPIYFVWLGSDVPQKFFNNLKKTADTNKTRDVILVYSEKHLLKNNRKNIDSIKNINIENIKARVELVRNDNTENLWKIDVYDMELDKQDKRIYKLFDQALITDIFNDKKSYKYCVASDLIRLPLINITGGIYFDMDAEITGKIGDLESKNGFNISYYYQDENTYNISSDPLIKTIWKNHHFNKLMKKYFDEINDLIDQKPNRDRGTDPVNYLHDYILQDYIRNYMTFHLLSEFFTQARFIYTAHLEKDYMEWEIKWKTSSEKVRSKIYKPMILNYGVKLPSVVKIRIKQGDYYHIDYNNPEQLRKLTNLP